jgi:hypothetical protein
MAHLSQREILIMNESYFLFYERSGCRTQLDALGFKKKRLLKCKNLQRTLSSGRLNVRGRLRHHAVFSIAVNLHFHQQLPVCIEAAIDDPFGLRDATALVLAMRVGVREEVQSGRLAPANRSSVSRAVDIQLEHRGRTAELAPLEEGATRGKQIACLRRTVQLQRQPLQRPLGRSTFVEAGIINA